MANGVLAPNLSGEGALVAEEGEIKVFVFSDLDCLTFPPHPVSAP
jgi:hypothetical protein